jgi:FtsZ-binding cell division protein ZapB
MFASRRNRSDANRTVTCLEALELGYDFVKTCARCDFYTQNKALNGKALTLPRNQLSKAWQCSAVHNVGELFHSQCQGLPYRAATISKSSHFICSDRQVSNNKRPRCGRSPPQEVNPRPEFDTPITAAATSIVPGLPIATPTSDSNRINGISLASLELLREECARLRSELNDAMRERDVMLEENRQLEAKCNQAVLDRDAFSLQCDEVKERYEQLRHRSCCYVEEIRALKENNISLHSDNENLRAQQEQTSGVMQRCWEQVEQLTSRIHVLESQRSRTNVITVGAHAGEPLRYINELLNLLYPEAEKNERLNRLFDLLYGERKQFRLYVTRKLSNDSLAMARLTVGKEIKSHFTAWRFLEVMDTSNQSLNQVSNCITRHVYGVVC